ncbi:RHS repeat-associated core domain-containing protein, partial [Burkholderia ubonensis]
AQYVSALVAGIETPERTEADRYTPEDDPLQRVPERVGEAHAFYYHCDQIGTPLLMTDELGDVVWEASYKAWGEAREVIARVSKAAGITPRNLLRFQGQQVDGETGLHYNRHRYYDPNVGRFISKDPIGLNGGPNVYQYASNPVEWIDPLGLSGRKEHKPRIEDGNSKEGWQHIDERHISGTHSSGAGDIFPPETSREELQRVCECLVKNGTRISDPKRRIQTYAKRGKVSGKRARVRGSFDSHDKNRTITLFPVEGE